MKHFFALACVLPLNVAIGQVVWSDDFSNPANWVMGHDGNVPLDWQIGVGLQSEMNGPIQSTTAANGYAMVDSYGNDNSFGEMEQAHLTTAFPVDVSSLTMPQLSFENLYRNFSNASTCYVVISTDGTFPALNNNTNITSMPNVFRLHDELTGTMSTDDPERVTLNITEAVSANPTTVWVRFYWSSVWAYSWYVDDVSIAEAPQVEIAVERVWLSNTPSSNQTGTIPLSQQVGGLYLGGRVYNLGLTANTSVELDVEINGPTACNVSVPMSDLPLNDTISAFQFVPTPLLAPGTYTATFTVSSAESGADEFPANNTLVRYFNVDANLYALDALDAVPAGESIETEWGTATFVDAADGVQFLNYVDIIIETEFTGYEVLLGPTEAGGEIVFALYDSADVMQNDLSAPLHQTAPITITAQMVTDGRVEANFTADTLAPGGYYVGVALYSMEGAFHVIVRDDRTYVPVTPLASLVDIPNDQVYSTPVNAMAIRLRLGDPVPCHAEYLVAQALDGGGDPIPFLVNIVNTSWGGTSDFDFMWDFGDGATSTDEFPVHDFATNGPYWVCLTIADGLGCVDQYCDSIMVDVTGLVSRSQGFTVQAVPSIPMGLDGVDTPAPGTAWPNPAIDLINFTPVHPTQPSMVRITDATGRSVFNQLVSGGRMDVSSLSSGAYVLQTATSSWHFMKVDR